MAQHSITSEGFGLLELMGALTVFAIAMIPLFSLESELLRNSSSALRSWSSLIAAKNKVVEREKNGNELDEEQITSPGGLPGQTLIFNSSPIPDNSGAQLFSFGRMIRSSLEDQSGKKIKKTTYIIFKPSIKRDDKAEEKDAKSEKRRRRPRRKKGTKTTSKGKASSKKTTTKTSLSTAKDDVRGKID